MLYFQPFSLLEPDASFNAIKQRWIVSPVLKTLVYESIPKSCISFVTRVERDWNFNKIIPCHLAGPVSARRGDLSKAFSFSFEAEGKSIPASGLPLISSPDRKKEIMEKDNGTLNSLIDTLRRIGAVYDQVE